MIIELNPDRSLKQDGEIVSPYIHFNNFELYIDTHYNLIFEPSQYKISGDLISRNGKLLGKLYDVEEFKAITSINPKYFKELDSIVEKFNEIKTFNCDITSVMRSLINLFIDLPNIADNPEMICERLDKFIPFDNDIFKILLLCYSNHYHYNGRMIIDLYEQYLTKGENIISIIIFNILNNVKSTILAKYMFEFMSTKYVLTNPKYFNIFLESKKRLNTIPDFFQYNSSITRLYFTYFHDFDYISSKIYKYKLEHFIIPDILVMGKIFFPVLHIDEIINRGLDRELFYRNIVNLNDLNTLVSNYRDSRSIEYLSYFYKTNIISTNKFTKETFFPFSLFYSRSLWVLSVIPSDYDFFIDEIIHFSKDKELMIIGELYPNVINRLPFRRILPIILSPKTLKYID